MFRVDDDESARELRALRQRAYLAELDAQVALKRERERRRDEAHAHRLFETQYARALENGADVASRAGRRAVNARSSSSTLISPSSSARDVRGVRESAGRAPFRFLDADAAGRRAERREKAERAAVLREELTRQMEEKELAREMRRLALMREEEEEERRLRAERAALTRRFERADAKPAKDSVSARVESVGEMLSTTSASGFVGGEEEEEEEEACEFFEETTFVELPEPKTTNVETMVDEAPASPVTPAVMSRSVSRSEGVEEEFTTPPAKTTTGDDVLLRQGSVKAMAKLWDTPAKQRRNMERAERSTFNDDAVEDY